MKLLGSQQIWDVIVLSLVVILQSMKNDLDTVALIMNNMSAEKRADVLAAMEPEFAASITKKLLP